MSRRIVIATSAAGAILVAGIAVGYATALATQRGGKAAARRHVARAAEEWSPIPPEWRLAKDPSTVYTVEPMPVRGNVKARTQQQERLLEQAADIVGRLRPVPEARRQFFSWMDRADSPVSFGGWGVFVEKAAPSPEGWLITLQVTPFATRPGGGPAMVDNCFIEQYLWSDGTLKYVNGFAHPRIGAEPSISSM